MAKLTRAQQAARDMLTAEWQKLCVLQQSGAKKVTLDALVKHGIAECREAMDGFPGLTQYRRRPQP